MALRCFVESLAGGVMTLPEHETRHALRSRRLSAGDAITLFDGRGHEAPGTLVVTANGRAEVHVGEIIRRPRPMPALTLAVALPKGPRQDTLIEKCTELGVAGIQPLLTERSVASASDHKLDKWRRTAIEAAKQSGQCWLPELCPPRPLPEVLKLPGRPDVRLVATLSGPVDVVPILDVLDRVQAAGTVHVLIGPEGGWTDGEIAVLKETEAVYISLGPNVLRIETAAIAVASVFHALARAGTGPPPDGPAQTHVRGHAGEQGPA